jgi:hypothetical protein
MGFSLEWVAVRGKEPRDVWTAMGLQGTGRPGGDAPLYGLSQANGWHVVVAHVASGYSPSMLEVVSPASRGADGFCGAVVESTGYSELSAWQNGVRLFRVLHDEHNDLGLEAESDLPPTYAALAEKWANDPSEIAIELAFQLIGFRYDEDDGSSAEELMVTPAMRTRFSEL